MKIYIPYSTWLGNIEGMLRNIDISDPSKLEITFDRKWVSIHPVVVAMISALGIEVLRKNPGVQGNINLTAHIKMETQLKKSNLFTILNIPSDEIKSSW